MGTAHVIADDTAACPPPFRFHNGITDKPGQSGLSVIVSGHDDDDDDGEFGFTASKAGSVPLDAVYLHGSR